MTRIHDVGLQASQLGGSYQFIATRGSTKLSSDEKQQAETVQQLFEALQNEFEERPDGPNVLIITQLFRRISGMAAGMRDQVALIALYPAIDDRRSGA